MSHKRIKLLKGSPPTGYTDRIQIIDEGVEVGRIHEENGIQVFTGDIHKTVLILLQGNIQESLRILLKALADNRGFNDR